MYAATDEGRENFTKFQSDRKRYLEPALALLVDSQLDLKALNVSLRALSGVYEQAARAAASTGGD